MTAKTPTLVTAFAVLIGVFTGCGQISSKPEPAPLLVGGDHDAHGCIGSAGYSWCSRENACVRSWELAQQHGFANSFEAFKSYCTDAPR